MRKEIHEKTKQFLNTRLEQTGFYPALNISADKGTNVHRSHQFTTAKSCIPNSPNLINSIFLGEPVVKHHDGAGVTESIKLEIDKFAMKPEQIEGASFDGAYFHQSVPKYLKDSLNLSERFIATHDPLHRAGIVDAHIQKDSNYSWLISVQETCSELYNKFNWGKNHELLLETCKELELTLASLTKFSKTRFANSIRKVTINIRKDFQIIMNCLKKIINEKEDSSISKDRDKAADAKQILRKISSKKFVLELSGISDIYDVFRKVVNTCQLVDILPFERFNHVKKAIGELKVMIEHIDHAKCVESYTRSEDFVGSLPESGNINGNCKWPSYHSDLSDLQTHGKYRGVLIKKSFNEKSILTKLSKSENTVNLEKDATKIAKAEIATLAKRLYDDLSNELFDEEVVKVIELTRNVSDLKSMAEQVEVKGSVLVGTLTADIFVKSSKQLTGTLEEVPDELLETNYRKFLGILENHIRLKTNKNHDSKELIKDFLNSDLKLFKGVEICLQSICAAAVKISVESDVESLVSRYEKHFKVDRQLNEENAEDEMEIAENGPLLIHTDNILKAAMNKYWRAANPSGGGAWHFVKGRSDVFSAKSKVIERFRSEQSKFDFLCK